MAVAVSVDRSIRMESTSVSNSYNGTFVRDSAGALGNSGMMVVPLVLPSTSAHTSGSSSNATCGRNGTAECAVGTPRDSGPKMAGNATGTPEVMNETSRCVEMAR